MVRFRSGIVSISANLKDPKVRFIHLEKRQSKTVLASQHLNGPITPLEVKEEVATGYVLCDNHISTPD